MPLHPDVSGARSPMVMAPRMGWSRASIPITWTRCEPLRRFSVADSDVSSASHRTTGRAAASSAGRGPMSVARASDRLPIWYPPRPM